MQIQKPAIREQIVKRVVKSGNGGAVWVPRQWMGQEVIVILPDKPKLDIKERVIRVLEPYLKDVIAVFIYGSYARHEETKESDIDFMVVTKDKAFSIQTKHPNMEITVFELEKLKKAIEKYPVMYHQAVQEAEPLINSYVLDELKKVEISNDGLKNYINEAKEHIESSRELIELDKLEGKDVKSYSALYSIMLRLRGIFIVECMLQSKKFSNKAFKEWAALKGTSSQEFEQCHAAYRAVRNNKTTKSLKIKISAAEKLLNILAKEINAAGENIHAKQKKEAEERN